MTTILTGDAPERLHALKEASFDACLCDPPYGLTERRTPQRMSGTMNRTGFMHMKWDAAVPPAALWADVLRVLKPGAPMLAFGGTRTFHRLMCAIEDAGFLISDTLCWLHGQGFPKSHAQLKPAWEPIVLAWKKGKRTLNIDGSRIPTTDNPSGSGDRRGSSVYAQDEYTRTRMHNGGNITPPTGRWPANLILDDEAAAQLDEQAGWRVSGSNPAKRSADKHRDVYAGWKGAQCLVHRGTDAGYASRFFYCAKASKSERGGGNTHPTVKPLKLCEYLARLILPPNPKAKLLVPFSGSGSEILGARRAGWKHITGIEREPAYVEIAQRRIAAA